MQLSVTIFNLSIVILSMRIIICLFKQRHPVCFDRLGKENAYEYVYLSKSLVTPINEKDKE